MIHFISCRGRWVPAMAAWMLLNVVSARASAQTGVTDKPATSAAGTLASDPAKPDPAKPDPAKPDPAKPEPAKPEPASTVPRTIVGDETGADQPRQSWRVTPSSEPPIQVRRAVDHVRGQALRVARAISAGEGVDASTRAKLDQTKLDQTKLEQTTPDQTEPSQDTPKSAARSQPPAKPSRRTLRRGGVGGADGSIGWAQLADVAGKILTAAGGDQLVLSPYVKDPRWLQAMALLKDDACDEAYELATDVVGPPKMQKTGEPAIRYALARIQMCSSSDRAAGQRSMQQLANSQAGPVADLARLRLGKAPRHTDADDDDLTLYQRIRHAKQRAQHGQVDQAIADLDHLDAREDSWWHRYKIRSAKVDILARHGHLKRATRTQMGIYRVARDWNVGDAVEQRLEQLQARAGVEVLTFGERVDRMRELISRADYAKARQVSVDNAERRGVTGDEIRGWGLYRRALQAERKRHRAKAAEMFAKADALVEDDAIRPRIYFGWARALRRLDRDTEAIALYDRICREYPRHLLCDDALFEAGRLSQYLGKHRQARDHFERVVGGFPSSDKVPEALWRGAFSAYLMGDFEAAERPLRQIIAFHGDQTDASELSLGLKAQYWLGAARLKAGDRGGARQALQQTINRGPLTWYGRLAAARLKEAGMPGRVTIPQSGLSAAQLSDLGTLRVPLDHRMSVAAQFCRLGLFGDAIEQLKHLTSVSPAPSRVHQFLAAVYLADDQPDHAHWIMKDYIDETGPSYHNLRDWGVAFPVNYMNLAHKFGVKYGVSPFLVEAIIRQESGFRPSVDSYAGAVGLMQLMPGTARYTKRTFTEKGGHLSRSRMVDPAVNVKLGTMYIRIQTAFAAGRIPLALAGYNAGPAPLESWFDRYGDRQLDAWVESITYREARGYVRKVFTSYVTYAGLYGDGGLPDINLTMPDTLRQWGDVPEVDRIEQSDTVSLNLRE